MRTGGDGRLGEGFKGLIVHGATGCATGVKVITAFVALRGIEGCVEKIVAEVIDGEVLRRLGVGRRGLTTFYES